VLRGLVQHSRGICHGAVLPTLAGRLVAYSATSRMVRIVLPSGSRRGGAVFAFLIAKESPAGHRQTRRIGNGSCTSRYRPSY
jgi:hypothetical protein